jgi:D-glycero-alpha-D-manno-heptose 1-phosphate guanylyltransferase
MEAIVLAGGLGARLRGVVDDVPKPMAPVQGRPFLAFLLDQLVAAGFETAILAVGYRHEAIRSHFGKDYRGLALRYSVEREPLGTGGAIRLACGQVSLRDIFVLNGDTYIELDFGAMMHAHAQRDAQVTMAVCQVPDVSRYGALVVSDGLVRGFVEKGHTGPGYINGGAYILGVALRDRLPPHGVFSFERDVLMPRVKSIQPVAFPAVGLFVDIGIPEDYRRAQELLAQPLAP